MISLLQIIHMLLDVLKYIIIAQIVLSWLINFNILNIHQPLINQIWRGINQILEPLYSPIRRRMPYTGAIDFAPLIVFIAILALQIICRTSIMKQRTSLSIKSKQLFQFSSLFVFPFIPHYVPNFAHLQIQLVNDKMLTHLHDGS